jgi:chorismate mutase/prephenate dehydratase
MALENVPPARIHRIYSHPQALAQCSDYLSTLKNCHLESFADTAGAARKISEDQDLSQAAIAGEEAADHYGLTVIKRNIANRRDNFTRFMIIAAEPVVCDRRIPCKTSIILATGHHEGALVRCLNVLAVNGLNMLKLESRPRPNVPWEYLFYIDFEGNQADEAVKKALAGLTTEAVFIKVLGSYPARTGKDSAPVEVSMLGRPAAATGPAVVTRTGREAGDHPISASEQLRRTLEKKPFKLASRLHQPRDTIVRVKNVNIGGDNFTVIAGPCSVESQEQITETARVCKENGAHILRGGVFKPRTSPYSFQGLGLEGLEFLAEAGRTFGLPVVTEVMRPHDVEPVAREADILQVGARNMQNFALLKAVGRVDRPVLLKRGMMASIEEWLSAAEYILAQGNQQVILCERGIRTFETATRNTFDISSVPVLKDWTHLPVITDPSHAVGHWRWVPPLCHASLAVGAHGFMVEVHDRPDQALSDGAQSLKYDKFAKLMRELHSHRRGDGRRSRAVSNAK